jgi:hypothetical protein
MPPAMAAVVPILLDHDIAVYRFRDDTAMDAEVYYATRVWTDSYFQGSYLKAVEVEKEAERVDVVEGWFWVPTAQARGNLITYLMEPETDDNLITWGWTDHILQETPASVEAAMVQLMGGGDPSGLTSTQQAELRARAQEFMNRRQQVPMMRVMTHQDLPVQRVRHFNGFQRNRFFRY